MSSFSFTELWQARGINRSFYMACLDHLYQRYLKNSEITIWFGQPMSRYTVTCDENSSLERFVLKWYSKTVPPDIPLPPTCNVNISFKFQGIADLARKCFIALPKTKPKNQKRRKWMPWLSGKDDVVWSSDLEFSVVYENNTRERRYRSVNNLRWEVTYFQNSGTLVVSLPLCEILRLLALPASQARSQVFNLTEGSSYVTLCGVSGQFIPVLNVYS